MKSVLNRILVVPALAGVISLVAGSASAQFSKPVVVMKGAVQTTDSKPAVVRLSIHETGASESDKDTDEVLTCAIQEITASKANSESGRYLLILKPDKKYWIHIEGAFIQSLDTLVVTPKSEKPLQLERNFTVLWRNPPQAGGGQEASPVKKD